MASQNNDFFQTDYEYGVLTDLVSNLLAPEDRINPMITRR